MSDQASSFVLKILSGSQYGVEVGLDLGTLSFGNGDDADVRFADMTLQPLHGELKLEAGRLEVRSTGGPITSASGLSLAGDDTGWHEIAQLDVLIAGTTRFALGAPNAKWARLLADEARTDPAARAQAKPGRRSEGRSGAFVAGVAGVAALLGLAAGTVLITGERPDLSALSTAAPAPPFEVLQSSIGALAFSDQVTVSQEVDGSIDVSGYVQTGRERNALLQVIDNTPLRGTALRELVYVREAISRDVTLLLDSRDLDVGTRLSPDGVLTLDGNVLDPDKARDVIELIKSEVLGLKAIDNQIRSANDYLQEMQDLLAQLDLSGRVNLRLDGLLVEANGVVPNGSIDAWVGFIEAYSLRFADILPLRSLVALEGAPQGDRPPLILGRSDAVENVDRAARVLTPDFFATGTALTIEDILGTPRTDNDGRVPTGAPAAPGTPVLETAPRGPTPVGALGLPAGFVPLLARLSSESPELFRSLSAQISTSEGPDRALLDEALTLLRVDASPQELRLLDTAEAALSAAPPAPPSPEPEAEAAEPGRVPPERQGPDRLVDLINRAVEPEAGTALPVRLAGAPGSAPALETSSDDPSATPSRVTGAPLAGPSAAASTPIPDSGEAPTLTDLPEAPALPAFDTLSAPDADMSRLMRVAQRLRDIDPQQVAGLEARISSLLTVGPVARLFDLAQMQEIRLATGQSLLPQPIAAARRPVGATDGSCWAGATITVEKLPVLLLWMEILSIDPEVDLSQVEGVDPRLFMEAALSPNRLQQCLERLDTPYAELLLESSVFLNESTMNDSFAAFLMRNVPRFDIDMSGINLRGDRYLQLTSGRKLREGMAPSLDSRLLLIGDLGLLLRVSDGYSTALYGTDMAWRVE
jgi:type III secretion system YscD/HrpQ family protein